MIVIKVAGFGTAKEEKLVIGEALKESHQYYL
jgi:hypothetical protein